MKRNNGVSESPQPRRNVAFSKEDNVTSKSNHKFRRFSYIKGFDKKVLQTSA